MARAIDCEIAKKRLQAWIDESEAQGFEEAARNFRDCISLLDAVPTLTPPNELRAGLYGKYTVYKNKDGSLVTDCFILRPAKDPAAVAALRAYAAATDNAELAADIINWVGAEPNVPLTIEQLREMDGEPVWIVDIGGRNWYGPGWAIVDRENDLVRTVKNWNPVFFEKYGERWLAYYRPAHRHEST